MADYDNLLRKRVDEVLYYIWDPIGSKRDFPQTRDEYVSYVDDILQLLSEGKTQEDIASFLNKLIVDQMGLQPNLENCNKVAMILLSWTAYLKART